MSNQAPYASHDSQRPQQQNIGKTIVGIVLAIVAIGFLMLLLLQAFPMDRQLAPSWIVRNQLKQVGIALRNYHAAFAQLPPAAITSSEGTPTGSWRIAVLPFMEEQVKWERWNTDEPWDSDSNSALHSPLPTLYDSPLDSGPVTTLTHVMAVQHPSSMMQTGPAGKLGDVTDGMGQTIMAVYVQNRVVQWASPNEITLPELQQEVANVSVQNPIFFLMGDGSVRPIVLPMAPEDVEAIVTRDQGDGPVSIP